MISNAVFRSNRSRKNAAPSPDTPAAPAYADTAKLNAAVWISKIRINCGPRGIIMTKSTATVNCTAASVSSRSHSLSGRRNESTCGRESAALGWVSEECAGVVKMPTFDADQFVVKARLGPEAHNDLGFTLR